MPPAGCDANDRRSLERLEKHDAINAMLAICTVSTKTLPTFVGRLSVGWVRAVSWEPIQAVEQS